MPAILVPEIDLTMEDDPECPEPVDNDAKDFEEPPAK